MSLAGGGSQPLGDPHQDLVADRVAVSVVDVLEVVEVHDHHRDLRVPVQDAGEVGEGGRPIGQSGQAVVARLPRRVLLGPALGVDRVAQRVDHLFERGPEPSGRSPFEVGVAQLAGRQRRGLPAEQLEVVAGLGDSLAGHLDLAGS